MSQRWFFVEPVDSTDMNAGERRVEMSEEDILAEYFDWWSSQMRKAGKDESLVTERNCIEDWIVVHWAQKVSSDEPKEER